MRRYELVLPTKASVQVCISQPDQRYHVQYRNPAYQHAIGFVLARRDGGGQSGKKITSLSKATVVKYTECFFQGRLVDEELTLDAGTCVARSQHIIHRKKCTSHTAKKNAYRLLAYHRKRDKFALLQQ